MIADIHLFFKKKEEEKKKEKPVYQSQNREIALEILSSDYIN